jgi:ribosomal-protein-serine acetyltransferase
MTTIPTSIRTHRLLLRPYEERDAEALLQATLETHEGITTWHGGTLASNDLTLERVKNFITECKKEFSDKTFIQYGAFDLESGKLIGTGSLHHLDWATPKGRIGYWIRSGEQGKGFATEIAHVLTHLALTNLTMERLEIRAEIRNPASGAIAKKLGYKYLTVFEKNKRGPNGDLWDLEIYVRHNCKDLPVLDISYA